jgi:hypothetical protein
MRKTWTLLRQSLPGLLTYGCACHVLQLLGNDISRHPTLSTPLEHARLIAAHYRTHLRRSGLAELRKIQLSITATESALHLPGKTRWNSNLKCVQSVLANREALILAVHSTHWNDTTESAQAIRHAIQSTAFWDQLNVFVEVLAPIAKYITMLESDSSTLGDVYASFLNLEQAFNTVVSNIELHDGCMHDETSAFFVEL